MFNPHISYTGWFLLSPPSGQEYRIHWGYVKCQWRSFLVSELGSYPRSDWFQVPCLALHIKRYRASKNKIPVWDIQVSKCDSDSWNATESRRLSGQLDCYFSNCNMHSYLEILLKFQILTQWFWDRVWNSAFLTSSHVWTIWTSKDHSLKAKNF